MRLPEDILARFESLGDNCEFGFVQRKYGLEVGGLLRWAITQIDPLIAALHNRFADFYLYDELTPSADDMVWANRYGLAFHSALRSYTEEGHRIFVADSDKRKQLYDAEITKMNYMRDKLIDRLNIGTGIFVYKANINIDEEKAKKLHAALRSYSPDNQLLVVLIDETLPSIFETSKLGYILAISTDLLLTNAPMTLHMTDG